MYINLLPCLRNERKVVNTKKIYIYRHHSHHASTLIITSLGFKWPSHPKPWPDMKRNIHQAIGLFIGLFIGLACRPLILNLVRHYTQHDVVRWPSSRVSIVTYSAKFKSSVSLGLDYMLRKAGCTKRLLKGISSYWRREQIRIDFGLNWNGLKWDEFFIWLIMYRTNYKVNVYPNRVSQDLMTPVCGNWR